MPRYTVLAITSSIFFLSLVQQTNGTLNRGISTETVAELAPGVVVEKVEKNSDAEQAGLQEGDLVLSWVTGNSKGEVDSPFDLRQVEAEQAPRGNVTLEGFRNTVKFTWVVKAGFWHIEVRPNFYGSLLTQYESGQELIKARKLTQGMAQWRAAAIQVRETQSAWLPSWLLLHAAEALAADRQWKEADNAYKEALKGVPEEAAGVREHLLQTWATRSYEREDWTNAEKHSQEAISERRKRSGDDLVIAASLRLLGNIAWIRNDFGKAGEYYRQALAIAEKLAPGSLAMAKSLDCVGGVYEMQGEFEQSEEWFRQALAIQRKFDPQGLEVAQSLALLARVARQRSDTTTASEYLEQVVAIQEKFPDSLKLADTFNEFAFVALERSDPKKAEGFLNRAIVIEEKLAPGGLAVAWSLDLLSGVAVQSGDLTRGEEYEQRALAIREKSAPGSVDVASSLDSLGIIHWMRGDFVGAVDSLRKALEIYKKIPSGRLFTTYIMSELAEVAHDQGDLAQAEEYASQSLEGFEQISPGSSLVVWNLDRLGRILQDRGNLPAAEKHYSRALALYERFPPNPSISFSLYSDLGGVARAHGDMPEAEKRYRQALDILQTLDSPRLEHVETMAALAGILRSTQRADAAAQLYEQALAVFERYAAHLGGAEMVRSGFRAKYARYYKDYIDLLVSLKQPELGFHIVERWRARTLLEMLAASHLDIHKGVDSVLLDQERSLKDLLRGKVNNRILLLSTQPAEKQIQTLDSEIAGLLRQQEDVEVRIRANSPAYAALIQPQPLSAKQVEQLLDEDTLLLEYSLGEERSYVFAVTSNSVAVYELPRRDEIEGMARQIYQLWTAQNYSVAKESAFERQARLRNGEKELAGVLATLSRIVLEPVAAQLKNKRLLIVSDGALQYIPFAALPEPESLSSSSQQGREPLVVGHEIVNLPSASVLATLRRETAGRKRAPKAVAVFADPVFAASDARVTAGTNGQRHSHTSASRPQDNDNEKQRVAILSASTALLTRSAADLGLLRHGGPYLPRLPFSRREAQAILSVTPEGQGMQALDFKASRSTATGPDLSQYRVVHFATHGLLNSEHPELSGLVLSLVDPRGTPQDGFLGLEDVYNLNLSADLVVLSACETGLGKEIQGEGLLGLTRGFMYAGASRVVASLWSVDDAATAELMRYFYKAMEQDGMRPAAALRWAQMEIRKQDRWSQPYYWAGFVIQGEWK